MRNLTQQHPEKVLQAGNYSYKKREVGSRHVQHLVRVIDKPPAAEWRRIAVSDGVEGTAAHRQLKKYYEQP